MKKFKKIMLTLLLMLPIFCGLVGGGEGFAVGTEAEETAETEVEIVLHKRIFRDLRWYKQQAVEDWNYQNTGSLLEEEDLVSDPFNGAIYRIFDADKLVAEDLAADPTLEAQDIVDKYAAMKGTAILEMAAEKDLPEITSETGGWVSQTDAEFGDGIVRVTLPAISEEGTYKNYLMVETGVTDADEMNVDMKKYSRPLLVMLPVSVSDEVLNQIHIYPKNVGYVRDPYFYKHGQDEEGNDLGPIAGAKFALYRLDDAGEKWYLDMSPTTDLRNKWVQSEDPLNDDRVNIFTSDENGLVDTDERFLPSGTFYFEELQTVEGYTIDEAATKIEVVIPDSWTDDEGNYRPVLVNGQEMAENPSGEVPDSAQETHLPRVYNMKHSEPVPPTPEPEPEPEPEPTPEPTPKPEPTPISTSRPTLPNTAKPQTILPKTGAEKATISLLGIAILAVVVAIWRQRKKAE